MSVRPSTAELQLTVGKLLQLAYNQNEGVSANLLREAGPLTLTVDQSGNARLSGQAGIISFGGGGVLDELGVTVRRVSVSMTADGKGGIEYRASFTLAAITVSVLGSIDVEQLIMSCSGLLCHAARALRARPAALERQLREALGQ